MKKISRILAIFIAPLSTGLLIALLIQGAAGVSYTEPDDSPDTFIEDVAVFDTLSVGSGNNPAFGDLIVNQAIEVQSILKVDTIEAYSGNTIVFDDNLEASRLGTFYLKSATCTSCWWNFFGQYAGMYTIATACDAGDQLVTCNAWIGSTTKKMYGTDVYRSGSTYWCKAVGNGSPMTVTAMCLSPDETTRTPAN